MKNYLGSRKLPSSLKPLPFNSGYFMSFECEGFSAEALRQKLLDELGIGTISMQDKYLRIAFSSVEESQMAELLDAVVAKTLELSR
jgi:hypothetical protein